MQSINRRNILRLGASGLAAGAFAGMTSPGAFARSFEDDLWHYCPPPEKKILLVFLRGGNDGTNTVYPHADPLYAIQRPTLAFGSPSPGDPTGDIGSEVCRVHPVFSAALEEPLLQEMAFIHRVGYAASSRSHFSGQQIWETAAPTTSSISLQNNGFLGRYIQEIATTQNPLPAAAFEGAPPQSLFADDRSLPQIPSILQYDLSDEERQARLLSVYGSASSDEVVRDGRILLRSMDEIRAVRGNYVPSNLSQAYPNVGFGRLAREATYVLGSTDCKVATLSLGDFDTHSDQDARNNVSLDLLGRTLRGIREDAQSTGLWGNLTVVIMSEFGRSDENNSGGTDHGKASVMMLAGGAVTPGAYNCGSDTWFESGSSPLEPDGALSYRTDFRTVLAEVFTHIGLGGDLGTIVPNWPVAGDPNQPAAFAPLGLFG